MPVLKITRNGVVTLPAKFRKVLGLKQGDFVNAEIRDGRIILRPAKIIDSEDAWFYTKKWQKGEAKVDREIAEGRLAGPFSSADKFIKDLEK